MLMIQGWTTMYHPTQVQLEILSVCSFIVCHNYNAIFIGISCILWTSSVVVQQGPADSYILCSLLSSEFPDTDYGFIVWYLVELSRFDALLATTTFCTHCTLSCLYIYIYIYLTVYGNTDVAHSDANAITKRLFPARVRKMHRNGNEGFEEEFQVRLK